MMMLEMKTTEFLEALSSSAPVPGGGGASAAAGAVGAALGLMVANLTVGKKKYADFENEILEVRRELEALREHLAELADRDAQAFAPLARAYGMPKDTEEHREERAAIMEKALYEASVVPLEIMETILKVMRLLEVLGEKGSQMAVSDVGAGILLSEAALKSASLNVFINTKLMKEEMNARTLNEKADSFIRASRILKEKVYNSVLEKVR